MSPIDEQGVAHDRDHADHLDDSGRGGDPDNRDIGLGLEDLDPYVGGLHLYAIRVDDKMETVQHLS